MAPVWNIGMMKMISVPVLVCLFLTSTFTDSVSSYPEKSYALYFPNKDVSSYANIWGMPSLTAFTICFWISTSDTSTYSTVLSYSVPGEDNEVIIEKHGGLRVVVKRKESSKVLGPVNDGQWHHICFTWQSSDGAVNLYKDGTLHNQERGLQTGYTIKGGGSLVLGQEQDSLGGGFKERQSFKGHLANLNMWSYVLPATEVKRLSESCLAGEGNVYKWNDFIYGIKGETVVVIPSPCGTEE